MSLIEKAEAQIDEDEAAELERKLRKHEFTLDDFLDQLQDDPPAWGRCSRCSG